ncbi:hypothetical protein [Streptomyces sp. NPDC007088]|uniref:hypothetical protein n=1 Tax=Streptomyces sp. NPDC007088 TaxID=3364773 RepID=UPI00367A4C1C
MAGRGRGTSSYRHAHQDIRAFAAISREEGTEARRLAFFEAHRGRVLERLRETRAYLAAIDAKIAYYRAVSGERGGAQPGGRAAAGGRAAHH